MKDAAADLNQRISERVRELRAARALSLDALASKSGVSRSMISLIERGETSPTAVVLEKLAGGLGVMLAALFDAPAAEGPRGPLARRDEQPEWRDPASGYVRRQVFERADHPVELVRVELPPGAHVGFPAASYRRIRQLVWVVEGELVMEEAGERRRLAAGDCLAFGPPADSAFINDTATPCVYLVVVART